MTPVSALVQTATRELSPINMQLPPIAWSAFTALNKVHGVWRWYRRIELYRNPENFSQLLAGHAVNFVVGDYLLVRIAAQCVLIATRVLECVDQQVSLYREGCLWVHAVLGHYPMPVKAKWNTKRAIFLISPTTQHWWKTTSIGLYYRLKRVIWITVRLFEKTFKLSMKMMDAMDAFSLSPTTRNEGINELFVNTLKWLDTIVERRDQLMQGITNNRAIIEKILYRSPFNYEQLHDAVSRTLDQTETVYKNAKEISQFGNGMIIDFGKRALNTGMVVAGLASLRPSFLAHPIHPDWDKAIVDEKECRYPPTQS